MARSSTFSTKSYIVTMKKISAVWKFEEKNMSGIQWLFLFLFILYSKWWIRLYCMVYRYVRSVSFQRFDGLYNDICPAWKFHTNKKSYEYTSVEKLSRPKIHTFFRKAIKLRKIIQKSWKNSQTKAWTIKFQKK